MNRFKLYAASLLGVGILAVAACRGDDDDDTPGNTPRMGSTGVGGSGGGSAGSGTAGNTPGAGSGGGATNGSGVGGSGGGAAPLEVTTAQVVNALDPTAAPVNRLVSLKGLVVTTQKTLLSGSGKVGAACIWSVYATTPGATTQPYGSVVLMDYGDQGNGDVCPFETGKSGTIPNDIAPGDVIDVTAFVGEFANKSCNGTTNPTVAFPQRQLQSPRITITAKGGGTIPAPQDFATIADLDKLADQSNPEDINRKWQYGLVRIAPPVPLTIKTPPPAPPPGTCAADRFGAIRFNETNLNLNDNVFFKDTTNGGPEDPNDVKGFNYTTEASITGLTGIYALNFCTWAVSLRDTTEASIQPLQPTTACTPQPDP